MKKQTFFIVLGVMLLLIPGALWADNQPGVSQDTPAILVSLGQANAIPLHDAAAAAVRGQAQYVLVKVIGLNTFDFGPGVHWTLNPFGYRYGNWGGPNYTAKGPPVDPMDTAFMFHDQGLSDLGLLGALELIKNVDDDYWGRIYNPDRGEWVLLTQTNAPSKVYVYGFSLIGGRVFNRPVEMPYTEYSRREAVYGMQLLILGKSLLRIN